MAEGAKNVVKLLGSRRTQDRKALAEVRPRALPLLLLFQALLVLIPAVAGGMAGLAVRDGQEEAHSV